MTDRERPKGTHENPEPTFGDLNIIIAKGGVAHSHFGNPDVAYVEGVADPVLAEGGVLRTAFTSLKVYGNIGSLAVAKQNGKLKGSGNPRMLKVGDNSAIIHAGNPEVVEVNGSQDRDMVSRAVIFGEVPKIKLTGNGRVAVYSLNEDYEPDSIINFSEEQYITIIRPQDARTGGGDYLRSAIEFLFMDKPIEFRKYDQLLLPYTPNPEGVRDFSLRNMVSFSRSED